MNKTHRIVWSASRQAYVVAHEKAATHGKPSSTRKAVAGAVASALMALAGGQAMAVSDCTTHGTIVFDGSVTTAANATGVCNLANSDALTVTGTITQTATRDLDNLERSPFVSSPALYVGPGVSANSITVGATSTLSGNAAIQIGKGTVGGTLTGNIVNAGRIIGKDGIGIAFTGHTSGTWSSIGTIFNSATGTISGDTYGIKGNYFNTNGITNSGLIQGGSNGAIDLTNANMATDSIINEASGLVTVTGGTITLNVVNAQFRSFENAGRIISPGSGAVYFANNTISDGITNSGTLQGDYYGFYSNGGDIRNGITNTGSIVANGPAGNAYGLYLSSHTLAGGITNSGLISSNASGANVTGMYIGAWSTGQSIAGDIVNTGTIQGSKIGIHMYGPNAVSLDGSLVNSGTIAGGVKGIVLTGVSSSGGITNDGKIDGGVTGIWLKDTGGRGVNLTGGITNSGQIVGVTYSLKSDAASALTVSNTGLVDGRLALLGNTTLDNAGVVALPVGSSTMTGNFNNLAPTDGERGGILRMDVAALASYAKLTVSGATTINTGSVMDVNLARTHDVTIGSTLTGVMTSGTYAGLFAGDPVTSGIRDNSVLLDFTGIKSGNNLDLVVLAGAGDCASPISTARTGPCEVGFDSTSKALAVNTGGSVTNGDIGVHFLAGLIAGDNASLDNAGSISGNVTGLRIDSGAVAGGITNSGTITGGAYAVSSEYGAVANIANSGFISGKIDLRGSGNFANAGMLALPAGNSYIGSNFTNTGTFSPTVVSNSRYSKLTVGGTAQLGGTLFVNAASAAGLTQNGTLTGVITASALTGQFASYDDDSSLFNFEPVYSSNSLGLKISAASNNAVLAAVNNVGATPAAGAAAALDQIFTASPTGAIATLFQANNITGDTRTAQAVLQSLPLMTSGTAVATENALSSINRVIQARAGGNGGLSSGDGFLGDRNVWAKPFGSWVGQNEKDGVDGYKAKVTGIVTGMDRVMSEKTRLGLAFAYANAGISSRSNIAPQDASIAVYQLIGYGSYTLDAQTELNFQADFGRNHNDGKRFLPLFGLAAKGNYDSTSLHLGAGIGRTLPLSPTLTFIPSARLDYTRIRDDAYRETGAGALNLDVKSRVAETLLASVDGKWTFKLDEEKTFAVNAGIAYDLIGKRSSLTSAFAGSPVTTFVTEGPQVDRWMLRVGLGYTQQTTSGMEFVGRYDLEGQQGYLNQTASVKLRWAF